MARAWRACGSAPRVWRWRGGEDGMSRTTKLDDGQREAQSELDRVHEISRRENSASVDAKRCIPREGREG